MFGGIAPRCGRRGPSESEYIVFLKRDPYQRREHLTVSKVGSYRLTLPRTVLKYGLLREVPQPTRVIHEKRLLPQLLCTATNQRILKAPRIDKAPAKPSSLSRNPTDLLSHCTLVLNSVIGRECFTKSDFFPRPPFPLNRGQTKIIPEIRPILPTPN